MVAQSHASDILFSYRANSSKQLVLATFSFVLFVFEKLNFLPLYNRPWFLLGFPPSIRGSSTGYSCRPDKGGQKKNKPTKTGVWHHAAIPQSSPNRVDASSFFSVALTADGGVLRMGGRVQNGGWDGGRASGAEGWKRGGSKKSAGPFCLSFLDS